MAFSSHEMSLTPPSSPSYIAAPTRERANRHGGCHRGEIVSRTAERRRPFRVAGVGAGATRFCGAVRGMARGVRPPGPAWVSRYDPALHAFRVLRKELSVLPVFSCRAEERGPLRP